MKIAIPLAEGKLTMHFGHCAQFAIIDFDEASKTITGRTDVDAPPHEPGLLPKWLGEKGVGQIIAGGMGQRAQGLFSAQGITVIEIDAGCRIHRALSKIVCRDYGRTAGRAAEHVC